MRGWRRHFGLFALGVAVLVPAAASLSGCATYTQDLDRARRHYQSNDYDQALALLRVLERDWDSLSRAERVQYAYFRGMTDYRLASASGMTASDPSGRAVGNPQTLFRGHARYWLGISSALEKDTPGSLNDDEKERLGEALSKLNHDVYGGSEVDDATSKADGAASDAPVNADGIESLDTSDGEVPVAQ